MIAKIELALEVLDKDIEKIDARLMAAGADMFAAQEIQVEKDAKAAKQELYYAEWERLEAVVAEVEAMNAAATA